MTTWVLLRGWAREAGHWGAFVDLLRASVPPGDAVLPLDLPGNGERHREPSPVRIADVVVRGRESLQAMRARPPYRLLALSLGGMVALEWARTHPLEVAGCVLINSSFAGLSPVWHRLRPGALLQLAALLRPGLDAQRRERALLRLTSNRPIRPEVEREWVACAQQRPVSGLNVLRQLSAAARYRLPGERLPVPLVLLASQEDRLVSVRCSRALAAAWRVPLHVHPDAGHDLPLDDPEWVIEKVRAAHVSACIQGAAR